MRIALVTPAPLARARSGGLMRYAATARALSALGDLDVYHVPQDGMDEAPIPDASRTFALEWPERRVGLGAKLGWLVHPRLPSELVGLGNLEFPKEAQEPTEPYDVVWYCTAQIYLGARHLPARRRVVDLNDLEDVKIARLGAMKDPRGTAPPAAAISSFKDRRRIEGWRSLQRRIAGEVDLVTVCSEADGLHLGEPNVRVLPNTYEPPTEPVGIIHTGGVPRLLLPGLFEYGPNIDAACWFTTDVLPVVSNAEPDVQVRLVGRAGPAMDHLHRPPHVYVTGEVPEMAAELAGAWLTVVPIRYGAGTRVKVLESFAHGVPVVATSIGAEGLDVHHEQHLLIADTAEDFGAACLRMIRDAGLRTRLASAASELHARSYSTTAAVASVSAIVREATAVDVR